MIAEMIRIMYLLIFSKIISVQVQLWKKLRFVDSSIDVSVGLHCALP